MRIDHNCRIYTPLENSIRNSTFPMVPAPDLTLGCKGSIVKTNFQPILYQIVALNLIQISYNHCHATLMQH